MSVDLYGQQIGGPLEEVATFAKAVGGCPANVAIGVARLGLKSALISRVGDEPMGRFVREQLEREGVATDGLRTDPRRLTSLVLLAVKDEQTFPLIFYRENCADSALCEEDIDAQLIASARAVLVTGTHFSLASGARAQQKAIGIARANARAVVLDIDYRPNLWGIGGHAAGSSRYAPSERATAALSAVLGQCELIVGTEEEMHIAGGCEDTLAALRRIRSLSDAVIVCKRGALGCAVFPGRIPAALEQGLVAPAFDIEIYNVLGAGDAFLAGFLSGYLRGASHEESARRGNACGALAVSRLLCSPEFPTSAELDHLLTHRSRYRALRHDPELNHLHHVTTRRPQPAALRLLNTCGATVPAASTTPETSAARLDRWREVAVAAVSRVAAGREGFGLVLDATAGPAWREAARSGLWAAAAANRVDSRPLEFSADSLALRLTELPVDRTVYCQCQYHAGDPEPVRVAQERRLKRLAAVCRAQSREWLLHLASAQGALAADALEQVLTRLYSLDVRPDWWALELQPDAWGMPAQLIARFDPWCRGVLLALRTEGECAATFAAAARAPLVRGFIAGGSISADTARSYLARDLSEETAIAELADRFAALTARWAALRGAELERGKRSAN